MWHRRLPRRPAWSVGPPPAVTIPTDGRSSTESKLANASDSLIEALDHHPQVVTQEQIGDAPGHAPLIAPPLVRATTSECASSPSPMLSCGLHAAQIDTNRSWPPGRAPHDIGERRRPRPSLVRSPRDGQHHHIADPVVRRPDALTLMSVSSFERLSSVGRAGQRRRQTPFPWIELDHGRLHLERRSGRT